VRGVPLSRCSQCGLLGTTHFVTRAKTPDGLYDVDSENLAAYQKQYLPHRVATYGRVLPQLEQFRKTNRLLEVGSGYGYFLDMASRAKWESEGVEISPYCCQMARQRGCKVWEGQLSDAAPSSGTYDIVILWDVIEHFTEPDKIIHQCRTLLRPGGALVMRTPDARALASSLHPGRVAYRHLAYPANTAEHVFHFEPRNLTDMVSNLGFNVHELDSEEFWEERVISGNNRWVRAGRWLIMRHAYWSAWPYEFVITAVRA